MSSGLKYLQTLFRSQCNGYWEHGNGITIETFDKGGWMVTIDVADTNLEGKSMQPVRKERTEKDWIVCSVEHGRFRGQGDSAKLDEILESFVAWANGSRPPR